MAEDLTHALGDIRQEIVEIDGEQSVGKRLESIVLSPRFREPTDGCQFPNRHFVQWWERCGDTRLQSPNSRGSMPTQIQRGILSRQQRGEIRLRAQDYLNLPASPLLR